jgi:hypothetical protein
MYVIQNQGRMSDISRAVSRQKHTIVFCTDVKVEVKNRIHCFLFTTNEEDVASYKVTVL